MYEAVHALCKSGMIRRGPIRWVGEWVDSSVFSPVADCSNCCSNIRFPWRKVPGETISCTGFEGNRNVTSWKKVENLNRTFLPEGHWIIWMYLITQNGLRKASIICSLEDSLLLESSRTSVRDWRQGSENGNLLRYRPFSRTECSEDLQCHKNLTFPLTQIWIGIERHNRRDNLEYGPHV